MRLRPDLTIIAKHVARGSKVLDVGCGGGELLAALRAASEQTDVAPIESAHGADAEYGWLRELEADTAAAAEERAAQLDDVLRRRRNAG